MENKEKIGLTGKFIVTKYKDDESFQKGDYYERNEFSNGILDEGATYILNALIAAPTTYMNNANARVGTGTSTAVFSAAHTDLQANGVYKAMESGYPSISGRAITFRGVFGSGDANQAWEEFCVDNGTDTLNRAVSSQGTKASGQTWTLDVVLTIT